MKTAMILAAGRGERLRPLTDKCPKSLCQVGQWPLIVYHINKLAQIGFTHIVINHAWLGWKIRQYLGNGSAFNVTIEYSPEPPGGLETGGGIVQALPLLGNQAFTCINADIYTDFDFKTLKTPVNLWDIHLVLVNNPKHNIQGDFNLNPEGMVQNTPPSYTFSGIAVYHPRVFDGYVIGRFSVTQIWRSFVQKGKVSGQIYTGLWLDVGCYERLQEANAHATKNKGASSLR